MEGEGEEVVVTRVAVFGRRMPGKRPLHSPTAARTACAGPAPELDCLSLFTRTALFFALSVDLRVIHAA